VRLYEGSVGEFRGDVVHNVLADKLATAFEGHYRRPAPKGEVGAWQQSLNFLKNSFEIADLDEQRVIVEYELPYSSRRIDVLLFGRSSPGEDGIVLIELKQWSNDTVADAEAEGNVRVRFARCEGSGAPVVAGGGLSLRSSGLPSRVSGRAGAAAQLLRLLPQLRAAQ